MPSPSPLTQGDLLTEKEVADLTRLSPKTIGKWRRDGRLPRACWLRLGGRVVYRRDEIEAWITAQAGTDAA